MTTITSPPPLDQKSTKKNQLSFSNNPIVFLASSPVGPPSKTTQQKRYHPQPHRPGKNQTKNNLQASPENKNGNFGSKQPTPFCVERVTLSQPGFCHFCTAIFMASFTWGWLDGGYTCIYLDLPFVCKRNLPVHEQKPIPNGRIFTYLEDPGIYTHNIR